MKLTKQIKIDLAKAYQCAMEVSILNMKAPLRYINQYIAENVSGYGTAADEKVQTRVDYRAMLMKSRQQSKRMLFKAKIMTAYRPKFIDDTTVQFRDEITVQIGDKKNKHNLHLWFTTVFKYQHSKWQMVLFHGSMPDAASTTEDTFHLGEAEKKLKVLEQVVAQRTEDLQTKNRELEIETALEKVRATAMGMKKAEDMLSICKTISQQLTLLGVKEIRNVQTAIFYESRGTYMNYEYYAKHDRTFITDVDFKNHKIQSAFAKKMLKGPNEEVLEHLKGKKLQDWYAYQKTTNQFADKFILKAHSLNYYWYSLGPVALGTSTYYPLTKEETELFKRFLKVFELAYRRYLDIEKAEAQTREAQIETSLERIRAASLAMRDSAALGGIIYKLYGELTKLDAQLDRCFIMLVNPENKGITWWMAGQEGLLAENGFFVQMNQHASHLWYLDCWKKRRKKWQYLLAGKEKRDWDRFGFSKTELARLPVFIKKFMAGVNKINLTGSSDQFGSLVTGSFEPLPDEQQEIISRFTIAFNQAYIRFLDLQKAEAQAREAEIELALERVRARTMAMQLSSELSETAQLLFQQIKLLGVPPWSCGFNIWEKGDTVFTSYMGSPDGVILEGLKIPLMEEATFIHFHESRERGDALFIDVLEGEALEEHYRYFLSLPEIKKAFEKGAQAGEHRPTFQINHLANFSYGNLMFITYEPCPEAHDIFIRFAKVFEQTYTRFLDLQKAEAQAREAKIEMALERVRSRSLAMHSSGELGEVVTVVLNNLQELGYLIDQGAAAHLAIFSEGTKDFFQWTADPTLPHPVRSFIPYTDLPILSEFWDAKKKGHDFFAKVYSFEEKNTWFKFAFEHSDLKHIPGELKKLLLESETYAHSIALEKNSAIIINSITGNQLSDNQIDILRRFSKVFEQAYIRFLDLQKAEAQAREAQIQLALERVRAKTMAMQKSDELPEAATLLFQQVQSLGMPAWSTGYCTWNDDEKNAVTLWMSSEGVLQPPFIAPTTKDELFIQMRKGSEEGKALHIVEMGGKHLAKHYQYMRTLPVVGKILDSIIEAGHPLPTFQIMHQAYFSKGFLLFITYEPVPEVHDIFKRFAKVFEQTYIRFLDLQKAEAQAREAQIELGLERVRARAMAMQKSNELSELVDTVFKELTKLDFALNWCIINIIDEPSLTNMVWAANPETNKPPESYLMKFEDFPFHHSMLKGYRERKTKHVYVIEGKEKTTYDHYLFNETEWRRVPKAAQDASRAMKRYVATFSFSNFGGLQTVGEEYLSEENLDILSRFGKVFDLTYTRFNDLQKAEAQAREAKIEVALEKVRSRTMAMQKSIELGDVATVLFKEMNQLVDNLWTCGFVLCEKNRAEDEWWLSTESGFIPAFYLPNTGDRVHENLYTGWKNEETFRAEQVEGSELEQHYKWLMNIPVTIKIFDDMAAAGYSKPVWQKLHAAYFSKGYLVIITQVPCAEEEVFKRFAQVFDLTYTRFLDLQKAEVHARESQIELGLERVRASAMAMHSTTGFLEVTKVLREQVALLGEKELESIIIHIYNEEDDLIEIWYSYRNPHDVEGKISEGRNMVSWSSMERTKSDKKNYYSNETDYTIIADRPMLTEWYQYLQKTIPVVVDLDDEGNIIVPNILYYNYSKFTGGALLLITNSEASDNSKKLLKRSAKVFSLAYTRFLDLQKAEFQTRQAKIETALEKVRARALAMQQPEELTEVAQVMRHEMGLLGVEELETSSIYIHEEASENAECWYAIKDNKVPEKKLVSDHFKLQLNDTWVGQQMHAFYQSNKKQISIPMQGANRKEWIDYCSKQSKLLDGFYGDVIPDRTYHLYKFSNGTIGAATPGNISAESWDLLQRAASVFSLAYSRFKDLTQARIDLLKLKEEKQRAEDALTELQATQKQLIQSEKMASLGELTAGIAHEIQNPLNFVNNFSEVSAELVKEMVDEVDKGNTEEVKAIANDVVQNLEKINHHGKRAADIVKGMLEHSRSSSGVKVPTNINALADEYLRLAYHGLRAKDPRDAAHKSFNATMKTDFDETIGNINIIPQDIGRVILNLITNAFYVVNEKSKQGNADYEPTVEVSTKKEGNKIFVSVKDNGSGIPPKILDKIFQPFFTTKPTGQGTGLGLSLSYDIVKAHGGELKVETKEGEGSTFIIQIPVV